MGTVVSEPTVRVGVKQYRPQRELPSAWHCWGGLRIPPFDLRETWE